MFLTRVMRLAWLLFFSFWPTPDRTDSELPQEYSSFSELLPTKHFFLPITPIFSWLPDRWIERHCLYKAGVYWVKGLSSYKDISIELSPTVRTTSNCFQVFLSKNLCRFNVGSRRWWFIEVFCCRKTEKIAYEAYLLELLIAKEWIHRFFIWLHRIFHKLYQVYCSSFSLFFVSPRKDAN